MKRSITTIAIAFIIVTMLAWACAFGTEWSNELYGSGRNEMYGSWSGSGTGDGNIPSTVYSSDGASGTTPLYVPPLGSMAGVMVRKADANWMIADNTTDINVRDINVGGSLRGVIIRGNSMWVTPEANLQTAYNSLKSSTYNTAMGTLAVGSRRCLNISPGNYNQPLTLDTDYVDVAGTGATPNDVNIWQSAASATLTQTANDARLTNFKVANTYGVAATGGCRAFVINASDNSASIYRYLNFTRPDINATSGGKYGQESVWGQSDISGLWEYCNADYAGWRTADNKSLNATMVWCNGGFSSFGGDNDGNEAGTGTIGGKFYHCTGGVHSWGGCGSFGMAITSAAYFEDCNAGYQSFAIGKTFDGTALRCTAGYSSFGGDGNTAAGSVAVSLHPGAFTGKAVDCQAFNSSGQNSTLNHSFGQAFSNSVLSGTLIRCKIGDDVNLAKGVRSNQYSTDANSTIEDCFPPTRTHGAVDVNIHGFENGQTFWKSGTATKVFRLPNAYLGRRYIIIDGTDTAGADVNVKPQAADSIVDINGVSLSAGEGFLSDGDIFSLIELWVYKDNTWHITRQIGTWVQEAP